MSLIEREKHIELVPLRIKIAREQHERLALYASFIDSSFDHIIGQAIDFVIRKDKEFAAANGEPTAVETPTPRKKRSQARAAA